MRRGLAIVAALLVFGAPAAVATTINQTTLADSSGISGDNFGAAVAISGERVVVGAPEKDDGAGAVFIYERLPTGGWTGIKVVADDRRPGDLFGYSVAIDGDRIVVGALFGDGAVPDSGTAYLLEPAGSGFWSQLELPGFDGADRDYYGASVAISGDLIVVGADHEDARGAEAGAVYLHQLDGFVWTQTKLTAADGEANDLYGRAVATDGEVVVVGAIYADGTVTDQGAVYVYTSSGGGWTESVIQHSNPARWDLFGDAVAVSAGRIVAGAPLRGAAYIFEQSGGGWYEQQLQASDGTPENQFGAAVAISGDRVVVGAPLDGQTAQNAGAVYSYEWADATWFETKFVDADGSAGDTYGSAVGVDGDRAVVGVPLFDAPLGANNGRAYVIEPDEPPTSTPPPPAGTDSSGGTGPSGGGSAGSVPFSDIANTTFEDEIRWMVTEGITEGCGGGRFCPKDPVTRAQMATFLTRALDLNTGAANPFADVGGAHAQAAAEVAAAGISLGCGDGTTFCPDDLVTRAQMGSFFARALRLPLGTVNRFVDVRGTHAAAINAIAEIGITLGCNADGTLYCPSKPITRGQMAAFLYRAFAS